MEARLLAPMRGTVGRSAALHHRPDPSGIRSAHYGNLQGQRVTTRSKQHS
jgi:hypothetical protein